MKFFGKFLRKSVELLLKFSEELKKELMERSGIILGGIIRKRYLDRQHHVCTKSASSCFFNIFTIFSLVLRKLFYFKNLYRVRSLVIWFRIYSEIPWMVAENYVKISDYKIFIMRIYFFLFSYFDDSVL